VNGVARRVLLGFRLRGLDSADNQLAQRKVTLVAWAKRAAEIIENCPAGVAEGSPRGKIAPWKIFGNAL